MGEPNGDVAPWVVSQVFCKILRSIDCEFVVDGSLSSERATWGVGEIKATIYTFPSRPRDTLTCPSVHSMSTISVSIAEAGPPDLAGLRRSSILNQQAWGEGGNE
jgi:hypothetical protein